LLSLALGLLAVSLAVSACRPKITAPSEPPLAVRLGDDAFRLQDYEAAIEDYQVYIDSVERGEYTPFAFYQTALCWYRLEQYEQTLDVLDELDRRYDSEDWVQVAALRGDAQYKLGRRSAALIAWDEGWSVAQPSERPELRRRIVTVLREMDEAELAETRDIVDNPDVHALVEHHLAIERGSGTGEAAPRSYEGSRIAEATVPSKSAAATADAEEDYPRTATSGSVAAEPAPSTDEVSARADAVSEQADEVDRLSYELDETGDDVFQAIEETEQAEGEIRAVEASTATYAPLLRVDIPEPPFVDQPVPEPQKRIRVAPSGESAPPPPVEPAPAMEPAATADETIQEVEIVSAPAPPVDIERVDSAAVAAPALEEEPIAPVLDSGAKVGCVLPLTGADRAAGEGLLRSIRLVFGADSDQIVFRDSGSDSAVAREMVGELSADSAIQVAIAPAMDRDAHAIASSAERAAVPLLLVAQTVVPKSRYVLPVKSQSGQAAADFASQYQARYGAPPDELSAKAYSAALLARQALQIAPVPRGELLSRLVASPPPAAPKVTGSAGEVVPREPADAG
jgi:tetratricopeptide (TPR) repeat protein